MGKDGGAGDSAMRDGRLARALRDNLRRRKAARRQIVGAGGENDAQGCANVTPAGKKNEDGRKA
ncbi:MAG: hypothetical protein ACK5JM_13455 [Rhodoblastus sp.]